MSSTPIARPPRPDDTALAIEAAHRMADWAIENGAAVDGVHDDLRIIMTPVRRLQQHEHQQGVSDRALVPVIATLRARLEVRQAANSKSPFSRTRVLVDETELSLLLDALDPETRP